jgi:hypothetical protein
LSPISSVTTSDLGRIRPVAKMATNALLPVTILFGNAGAKFWKNFNHESATADKVPRMNNKGEAEGEPRMARTTRIFGE